jgi:hypothetical protein
MLMGQPKVGFRMLSFEVAQEVIKHFQGILF